MNKEVEKNVILNICSLDIIKSVVNLMKLINDIQTIQIIGKILLNMILIKYSINRNNNVNINIKQISQILIDNGKGPLFILMHNQLILKEFFVNFYFVIDDVFNYLFLNELWDNIEIVN